MTLTNELIITFTSKTHEKKCDGNAGKCQNVAIGYGQFKENCVKGCPATKLYCLEHYDMLVSIYLEAGSDSIWGCRNHYLYQGKLISFGRL